MTQDTPLTEQAQTEDEKLLQKACQLDPTLYQSVLTAEQFESLFEFYADVFNALAEDLSLQAVLDKLCLAAEKLLPNAIATIMFLDEHGKLQVKAAPSVPESGIRALNNLEPGPHSGSCGNVIYRQEPVFVENTLKDERWQDIRELAINFDLRACWSMPIQVGDKIIGTFALTSFEQRMPNAFQHKLLEMGAQIVSIAYRRSKLEEDVAFLAYHDPLTGLKNRKQLEKDIEAYIQASNGEPYSLILLGLNRFKAINDTYGHNMGDRVLQAIGQCIERFVNNEFPLYRVGSDEFALIFKRKNCDVPMVEAYVENLARCIRRVIEVDHHHFYLSASFGIACALGKQHFYQLMKEADMAMYAAKANPNKCYAFYDPSMAQKVVDEAELDRDLHRALEERQFVLYYQPLMDATGNKVRSLEALIRWQHPEKGLIPPFKFIPLAEETGMISQITQWVVDQVISDLKNWHRRGLDQFMISINISGQEFNKQQISLLIDKIQQADLAPFFEFELTEGYFMGYEDASIELLEMIRSSGISIAIDDFGTGYSSLSYLKRFPVDKLKVDQSLVRDIVVDENDQAIVEAVVAMSHALKLKVVAEGVETLAHQKLLENKGIDYLQGYLYAKPKPAVLVEKFIRQHV